MSTTGAASAGPTGSGPAGARNGAGAGGTWVGEVIEVVGRVQQADLDAADDERLRAELAGAQNAVRRLQAWQTRLLDALSVRAAAAAAEAGATRADDDASDDDVSGDDGSGRTGAAGGRAAQRARAKARDEAAQDTGMTPSRAKKMQENGRRLGSWEQLAAAFEQGLVDEDHVKLAIGLLDRLPIEVAGGLEADLVAAACRQNPVVFSRTCRALLAEHCPDDAVADVDRQHAARSARVVQRADGMTYVGAEVAGVDGAFVHATLDAFRTWDAQGEHRSAEQRTADAFMDMVRAASGTIGDPDARHGVPVFIFNLPAQGLLDDDQVDRLQAACGTEAFTGPLPADELARLIGDAHVAAVISGARGVPIGATRIDRAVPTGLWRALYTRDQGCLRTGCDAPPGWCQVAHLGDWHADGGRLRPDTAGLLCTRHHRSYDRGGLSVTWIDGQPTVHRHADVPDTTGATHVRTRRGGRHQREHVITRNTNDNVNANTAGTIQPPGPTPLAGIDGVAGAAGVVGDDNRERGPTGEPPGLAGGPPGLAGDPCPPTGEPPTRARPPDVHDQPTLLDLAGEDPGVYRARPAPDVPAPPAWARVA